jgi:hypothetical protein
LLLVEASCLTARIGHRRSVLVRVEREQIDDVCVRDSDGSMFATPSASSLSTPLRMRWAAVEHLVTDRLPKPEA